MNPSCKWFNQAINVLMPMQFHSEKSDVMRMVCESHFRKRERKGKQREMK